MIWVTKEELLTGGVVPFRVVDGGDTYLSPAMPWGGRLDVTVIGHIGGDEPPAHAELHLDLREPVALGRSRRPEGWTPRAVRVVESTHDIFERVRGLFETNALSAATVAIFGVGSGGSRVALELAMAGVGSFLLIDGDRIDPGNVIRHVCGLADVGRFKTKAVRDLILAKNPLADVRTRETPCTWDNARDVADLIRSADVVVCGTDTRESRLLINRISVRERKVAIFAGTFQRAYGGQVQRVTPSESACYQCFVDALPEVADDQEVSSAENAAARAYSDRPVAVEPGLSNDISPMSTMCVKLTILELLRGKPSTFESLYRDLSSSAFQWLNRREVNSPYESIESLEEGAAFRVLAWYPLVFDRNPACPACGNFGLDERFTGVQLSQDDIDKFGPTAGDPSDAET